MGGHGSLIYYWNLPYGILTSKCHQLFSTYSAEQYIENTDAKPFDTSAIFYI